MLKWTKEKPSKDGWYFYKRRSVSVVLVVWRIVDGRIFDDDFLYCLTIGRPVQEMEGEWAGPIEEPEE